MANFHVYPGSWVKVMKDFKNLKEGEILQILSIRYYLTFVGKEGLFRHGEVSLAPPTKGASF